MNTEVKPFNRETEKSFSIVGRVNFDLENRRTRFDLDAVAILKAKPHQYVHFVPIGDKWYVAVNADDSGYVLNPIAKRSGLSINNAKFIRWFFRHHSIIEPRAIFLLVLTQIEWRGCGLCELQSMV
jgi:hypothetical protein